MRGYLMLAINAFYLLGCERDLIVSTYYISQLHLSWECNKKPHLLSPLIVLRPFDGLIFTQNEDLIIRSRGLACMFKDGPLFIDASNPCSGDFRLRRLQGRETQMPQIRVRSMSNVSFRQIISAHQTNCLESLTVRPILLWCPPNFIPQHRETCIVQIPRKDPHRQMHLIIRSHPSEHLRALVRCGIIPQRLVLTQNLLRDVILVIPLQVWDDICGFLDDGRGGVEVPFVCQVPDDDAADTLLLEGSGKGTGALPCHRIGC